MVSSSLAAYFGASFYYVQNTWWSDVTNDFHFDPGNDLVYALNVDKAAHFFGGVYSSDLFSSSYRWAGVDYTRSLWYGACFGTGIQLAIELKDAYAPYWGFSKWDFAIGSAGSFWPVLQNNPIRFWSLIISLIFLFVAFVKPILLRPFYTLWIKFGEFLLAENGSPVENIDFDKVREYMKWDSLLIEINLKLGQGTYECYTCDFTNDYVNINADYRN